MHSRVSWGALTPPTPSSPQTFLKKLAPPLVTLLASEPEIQYVALRNIQIISQKRPGILKGDIKVFFCKYNDPTYVKLEKIDVMVMLCTDRNVDQVRTSEPPNLNPQTPNHKP